MQQNSIDFLHRLMSTVSPSGYEQQAARVFTDEAKSFASVSTDVHGNSRILLNAGGSPRVLLAAHYDEIGFLVTHIDKHGYLWVAPIGGWDPQIPQGQRVSILARGGVIHGVLGKAPVHVQKPDDRNRVTPLKELWVDIGAKDRDDALSRVEIGDAMVIDQGLVELPNDRLAGRAFDDRGGAFAVLEAARILSTRTFPAELHAVGTVQEEIGSRGAVTSTFGIRPDVGIAVDVTFATDHPRMDDAERFEGTVALGEGPVLTRGANVNPVLFDLIRSVAKANDIPLQITADGRATPTDADPIQISGPGVATALLSIPLRYMHTPGEVVALSDLENTARLLAETVAAITPDMDFRPTPV